MRIAEFRLTDEGRFACQARIMSNTLKNRRKNRTEAGPARKHALKSETRRDRLSDAKTAQISVNMIFVKSKEIQVAIFGEWRTEGLVGKMA